MDLGAVAHNFRTLGQLLKQAKGSAVTPAGKGGARICAVVKKDAYGLGAPTISRTLVEQGCDMLGVFCVKEAEALATLAGGFSVLLMMPVNAINRASGLYRLAGAGRLHFSIHDLEQITALERCAKQLGLQLPIHLYVDTGMSRSGLSEPQLHDAVAMLGELRHLQLVGIFSHLATADDDLDFAHEQRQQLLRTVADVAETLPAKVLSQLRVHLANSCGALRDSTLHMDMIRPGIALSGFGPCMIEAERTLLDDLNLHLRPAMSWWSKLIHVQHYPEHRPVGYGSTFRTSRESVLGLVPCGYADGYRTAWGNAAQVRVFLKGHAEPAGEAPVIGRVNMDQIIIDLTGLRLGSLDDLAERATIELISTDHNAPNSMPHLAKLARTHVYEVQCGLSPKLPRVYVKSDRD